MHRSELNFFEKIIQNFQNFTKNYEIFDNFQNFDKKVNDLILNYENEVIELRHWFHENAELSNREFKTAKFIEIKAANNKIPVPPCSDNWAPISTIFTGPLNC